MHISKISQILTWTCFLVCVQHISHPAHALVRVSVADANVLAVIPLCTRVWTWNQRPKLYIWCTNLKCYSGIKQIVLQSFQGWKRFLTWACFLISVQHVSHTALANVRVPVVDTRVLTVVSLSTNIHSGTWQEGAYTSLKVPRPQNYNLNCFGYSSIKKQSHRQTQRPVNLVFYSW